MVLLMATFNQYGLLQAVSVFQEGVQLDTCDKRDDLSVSNNALGGGLFYKYLHQFFY